MATTYKKLAELIRDTYYKSIPSDDANYSLRYFAELIAQEVAQMATDNAIENSNQGESTYANDAFLSVYRGLELQTRNNGERYFVLPATPTAMPNNQEVSEVSIEGSKCLSAIPKTNRQVFSQILIGGNPCGMSFFRREGNEIVFDGDNTSLIEGTVSTKLIGAVSGSDLLTSDLNIPKNYESKISTKILAKLLPLKQIPVDYINDAISNPS